MIMSLKQTKIRPVLSCIKTLYGTNSGRILKTAKLEKVSKVSFCVNFSANWDICKGNPFLNRMIDFLSNDSPATSRMVVSTLQPPLIGGAKRLLLATRLIGRETL